MTHNEELEISVWEETATNITLQHKLSEIHTEFARQARQSMSGKSAWTENQSMVYYTGQEKGTFDREPKLLIFTPASAVEVIELVRCVCVCLSVIQCSPGWTI